MSQQQQGWETTSHEYNLHINMIERMTSVLPDVPRYPNLHRVFNNNRNKVISGEEPPKKQKKSPTKKVQILDQKKKKQQNDAISGEQDVDTETDGFIQQRRKGFELCKWKTFKLH